MAERRPSHAPNDQRAVREAVEQRLAELEPQVDLLAVDVSSGRNASVAIFLDAPEGVTHELCVRVTRHLTDLLRDYRVEVSSPGPNRPLSKPEHFRRLVGRRVRVRTYEAVEGHSDFKAELTDAGDEQATVAAAWGTVTVAYKQIRRANLIAEAGRKH